ncbi:MAG: DUF4982 domain-containing protein [Lachnospiraceae bacterium]|nr:DUF4982 domain-containing protein [Lachnospiraceae bacterium]
MLKIDFNHDWKVVKEGNPSQAHSVTLPHDAMIHEERDRSAVTGAAGGYFPGGSYTYTKEFQVPKEAAGESWFVEFEGAYLDSYVYLNQSFVMSNHSGTRGFEADLTPYLKPGEKNTLEVTVKNDAQPNSRWYTGSGLYRPVWLYRGGSVRIALDGVRITTPEAEPEVSKVTVAVSIENRLEGTDRVRLRIVLKDKEGQTACTEDCPVTLFPGESPVITQSLYLRDAKLWSLEEPYLYACEVSILRDGVLLDSSRESFGIRHIQMDPVKGLRLNGKRVLLRGSCVHADHGILGAAVYADAEERRVMLSKGAGFNALRIAHQSASRALLEACDKQGMLLMEESFDQWHVSKTPHDYSQRFEQEWEKEVEAIVAKDFNHPCVFMYSIGNEIQETGRPDGIRMSRSLVDKFRSLDPTRFVTNAVNGGMMTTADMLGILADIGVLSPKQLAAAAGQGEEAKPADINEIMTILAKYMGDIVGHRSVTERLEEPFSHLDACGYNYMQARYQKDMEEHPNRIIFGSETNPPKINLLWPYTEENPACIGDFTWTGWDYIGESGIGITRYNERKAFGEDYPVYLAYCGDMDITGYRMPVSYYREIVYGLRKAPYLSVENPVHFGDEAFNSPWAIPETLENWTWPGWENSPVKVTVFSESREVALFCNGKEVGRAPCGKEHAYKAVLKTVYVPGELCAVGYTDGKEDGRFAILTAKQETEIRVDVTRTELAADGSNLSYVSIAISDEAGTVHCEREWKAAVKAEGEIELMGFGSADPFSLENFYDTSRTTWHGRALAAVRGTGRGVGSLTISAEGCEDVILNFQVI